MRLREVYGGPERSVDISDFRFISGIRPDPAGKRLAITGVAGNGRLPNLKERFRGDLRLYVIDIESGARSEVYPEYAHDPFWFPGGDRIAINIGNGVGVVRPGSVSPEQSFKVGAFTWGAPSVSVSRDGTKVGFVRWKGDSRHIAVLDLVSGIGKVHRPSFYFYSWFDDGSIVYSLRNGVKRLDLGTEKSSTYLTDMNSLEKSLDLREALPELAGLPKATTEIRDAFVHGGRAYFVASGPAPPVETICSMKLDRTDLKVHYKARTGSIREYCLLNGGRTISVYREITNDHHVIVENPTEFAGECADRIPAGFFPFPKIGMPNFGFHYMGELDGDRVVEPVAAPSSQD
jgi:hypothetical protein